jgi:hypothetical protein
MLSNTVPHTVPVVYQNKPLCYLYKICLNTFISEARFQHVVWVKCSSAHTKGLVLPHKTLYVDNVHIMV